MNETFITGLDIGSTAVRVAVAQASEGDEQAGVEILHTFEHPTEGFSRDAVSSMEDAAGSISRCLEKAERAIGLPIQSAWVGISGTHIQTRASRGVVAVGKMNGEITPQDFERAIEAAKAIATPPNYEILHVIPRSCVIDGQQGIKDPIGMSGVRLEVDTRIVQGLSSQIKNFTKCIYRAGIEIDDLVFALIATAEATLTSRQKELGVALVDIGGSTTSVAIYEEGEIFHAFVLPLGSDHITSDIAIGLRVSLEAAEKIKIEYGTLLSRQIQKKDEIDLSLIDPTEKGYIAHKYITEILEARVEEIFDRVETELKRVGRSGLLPAGVVLSGGGAKLPGIVDCAKRCLKLSASQAQLKSTIIGGESLRDPRYTTAIGLCFWGWHLLERQEKRTAFSPINASSASELRGRVKKWFKALLP
ncbi:MAG: cell division protein FtsA [bacterium]|nr:cell division protein FtsA [bacterium]